MIGLALAIWGVYFAAKTQAFGVAAGVPLGLGLVDVVLGLIITTCGYKRLFFLRLFMLINGLLCIGEIAMAILYIVPGTQGNLIDSLNLDDATADWVNDNIATAGYIFLTVVAVKVGHCMIEYWCCHVSLSGVTRWHVHCTAPRSTLPQLTAPAGGGARVCIYASYVHQYQLR